MSDPQANNGNVGGPPPLPSNMGAPSAGATPPAASKKNLKVIIGIVVAAALIGAALAVTLLGGDDAEESAGEIFLEPAAAIGPDPFSTEPLAPAPNPELALAVTEATVPPAQSVAVTAQRGDTPGLYGGTQDNASCDSDQLVAFLGANPDKAKAWVAALNADPNLNWDGGTLTTADIPAYVASLTPLVLREDTRVTNHGFKNGQPTVIRQSVLQKGSAVLIDKYGSPRVKCFCGNPLIAPKASKSAPKYTGAVWPDFDPAKVSVVNNSTTVINNFVVVDINTGNQFTRASGSNTHTNDQSVAGGTTTTTGVAPTTAAPATTAAPTAAPTTAAPAGAGKPSVSGAALTRNAPGDGYCAANFGPGVVGFTMTANFTDPEGDAGVVLMADFGSGHSDVSPDAVWTGDGASGSVSYAICGTPGENYGFILGDRQGNGSDDIRLTVPAA